MTFRPFSSLNLTHIRNISPQSELPTVPMASALASSPMFWGLAMASEIFFCRLLFIVLSCRRRREEALTHFSESRHLDSCSADFIPSHARIHFLRPGVDAAAKAADVLQAVAHEIGCG